MNTLFEASGFQVEITNDGSPTLKQVRSGESMHHSGGAASETWYIYGSVMETVFKQAALSKSTDCIQVCNVGLGLGYIEMAWVILNFEKINSHFDSFEISYDLQKHFSDWLENKESVTTEIYNLAWNQLIAHSAHLIKSSELRKQIQTEHLKRQLNFHGDIIQHKQNKKWNVICFDAFSNKTDHQIWTLEYLNYFLENHTASDCVFTTYASTSILKKALKSNGFKILNRSGFSGKRESTLAIRGPFMNHAFQIF